jgi:hypothetical protein
MQRKGSHTEDRQSHRGQAVTQRTGSHTEDRQSHREQAVTQ